MQQMPRAPVEGALRRRVPTLPAIKPDRLKTAKALVAKAVKLKKVFSVQGPYPVIRAALWARGWVERRVPHPAQRASHCHGNKEEDGDDVADVTDSNTALFSCMAASKRAHNTHTVFPYLLPERVDEGEKEEKLDDMYDLMSRLVRNETTYFHWTTRRDCIDFRSLRNEQMTNHYANSGTFTTKVGLCVNLRNLQWFDTADPDTFFPRCYRLGAEDEKQAFIEDFRKTACASLLQHVVRRSRWSRDGAEDNVEHQSVGPGLIDTALHVCQEFLNVLDHRDIDVTVETSASVDEQHWVEFLQDFYMVVHKGALITGSSVFVERCQATLNKMQEACPQLDTDGLKNIWIIKPGAQSRGRGIMCINRLEEILALVDSDRALTAQSKWVVQKYLECPLLVHGTKFDIRQWFLITDWNPLTVWFYTECYLRFSTQPYSTNTLDSSVHLCNNSIQKHFQPSSERHPAVPVENMWSCSQFRAYLQQQGRGAQWESVVVTGMQQAVVRTLQTAQDVVEPRKASFELYGADFMLGRDLKPWLLEINASPTMACSTSVTARLCPAVQRDTLRVVLDRRTDPSAYTGGFQLIFQQAAVEVPPYVGVNLLVEGAPVRRSRHRLHKHTGFPSPILATHFPPDQSQKTSSQTYALDAFCHSGKEKQTAVEKKRQRTKTSFRLEREGRTDVQNTSRVDAPLMVHTEPQRKAQRLGWGLGAKVPTLVPRSFSFSLGAPVNTGHQPLVSRSVLPQTAFRPQQRSPVGGFPSIPGPLPTMEVFSLRPRIVSGTSACRNPRSFTHHSVRRRPLFLRPQRQSMARFTEEEHENDRY
ncbi:tubulin monoglycylase TTLL3 [Spinachia spinachia]